MADSDGVTIGSLYTICREKLTNFIEKSLRIIHSVVEDVILDENIDFWAINREEIAEYVNGLSNTQILTLALAFGSYKLKINIPDQDKLLNDIKMVTDDWDSVKSHMDVVLNHQLINPEIVELLKHVKEIDAKKMSEHFKDSNFFSKYMKSLVDLQELIVSYHKFYRDIMSIKKESVNIIVI